jgi:hypothetical protein
VLHAQATLQELRSTAHYQRRLIDRAVALLRPGGALVYSTCTINPGAGRWLLVSDPKSLQFGGLVQNACRFCGGRSLMPCMLDSALDERRPSPVYDPVVLSYLSAAPKRAQNRP